MTPYVRLRSAARAYMQANAKEPTKPHKTGLAKTARHIGLSLRRVTGSESIPPGEETSDRFSGSELGCPNSGWAWLNTPNYRRSVATLQSPWLVGLIET